MPEYRKLSDLSDEELNKMIEAAKPKSRLSAFPGMTPDTLSVAIPSLGESMLAEIAKLRSKTKDR